MGENQAQSLNGEHLEITDSTLLISVFICYPCLQYWAMTYLLFHSFSILQLA